MSHISMNIRSHQKFSYAKYSPNSVLLQILQIFLLSQPYTMILNKTHSTPQDTVKKFSIAEAVALSLVPASWSPQPRSPRYVLIM